MFAVFWFLPLTNIENTEKKFFVFMLINFCVYAKFKVEV